MKTMVLSSHTKQSTTRTWACIRTLQEYRTELVVRVPPFGAYIFFPFCLSSITAKFRHKHKLIFRMSCVYTIYGCTNLHSPQFSECTANCCGEAPDFPSATGHSAWKIRVYVIQIQECCQQQQWLGILVWYGHCSSSYDAWNQFRPADRSSWFRRNQGSIPSAAATFRIASELKQPVRQDSSLHWPALSVARNISTVQLACTRLFSADWAAAAL